jgi:hypothetical protein
LGTDMQKMNCQVVASLQAGFSTNDKSKN